MLNGKLWFEKMQYSWNAIIIKELYILRLMVSQRNIKLFGITINWIKYPLDGNLNYYDWLLVKN